MGKYAKIIITRKSAMYGSAINFDVEVDGLPIGALKNGGQLVTQVSEGLHIVALLNRRGKTLNSFSIVVEPDDDAVELHIELDSSQHPVLADLTRGVAAHLETGVKKKKKKRHPVLKTIGIIFLALLVLGALAPSDDEAEPSEPAATPQVEELTDEEKAAKELETASKEFQDGDYMAAIAICDEIKADFPDTDVAANMDAYLAEQYAAFPHFSAKDLMAEYDANVVNADEEYTDKIMVVTGTVSTIGKTNNDKNLTVLLKSGAHFSAVQLNFKTSQTEAVAALSEGDTVTAIGKCTGQSGTHLLVISGSNVMIENCYLIG